MTWQEYALSRQLLAEERVGTAARAAVGAEDAIFERNRKLMQRHAAAK